MDALTLATSRHVALTQEANKINGAVCSIRSQQLALSALSNMLCGLDRFPDNLEPEALSNLIDTITNAIAAQLNVITENSEAIDAKAHRNEAGGSHD